MNKKRIFNLGRSPTPARQSIVLFGLTPRLSCFARFRRRIGAIRCFRFPALMHLGGDDIEEQLGFVDRLVFKKAQHSHFVGIVGFGHNAFPFYEFL